MNLQDGRRISEIEDLILDPDSGRLLAYLISGRRLFGPKRILTAPDLREVSTDVGIIDSPEVLTDPEEVVRVAEVLSQKIRLIGTPVVTESGTVLGKLRDYAVDVLSHRLERINVRGNPLSSELIITADQILRIERSRVTVRDAAVPETAAGENLERARVTPPEPA